MTYLTLQSFARREVQSSRMLKKGGEVGPGNYSRRAKNIVTSPGLLRRMDYAAAIMKANCALTDACAPEGRETLVGKPVPGKAGKMYTRCTVADAANRLKAARACGKTNLSTKGGIYGSGS